MIAQGAGRAGAVDQLLAQSVPLARGAGHAEADAGWELDPDTLIRTLRAIAAAALPELKEIPEGLTSAHVVDELLLPYLALVAQGPRADTSYAVNDVGMWTAVDMVYVCHMTGDGESDAARYARRRLDRLAQAIMGDYHLQGPGTGVYAVRTELVATPTDRLNRYQQYFAELGHPLVAMVMTMEFLQIESTALYGH